MPETIDRYEILQKLAAGGMAELFLAKQSGMEGFEKVVVIKRILSHLASDQEFVNMFLDEARIAAKLSHPNVVQIYDLGRADDTYYIAMEYVSGRNVANVIKKAKDLGKPVPVEHVCRVISGVCDGLYYAHTRKDYDGKPLNIVHRDISPQNILVSFAGGVKLVDFGIAKASTQLAQTRAGVLKGKYSYMSPEQVRGDKIDARSDLFAVGICTYEMLTGQRPFERENSLKTLKAIVQEKPLNPKELNPSVPQEVVKILSRALEKDPNRRYSSAQEMQLALEDWLDKSPAKSNNVRLSRYLHEMFDDELATQGSTLEVKGIGEVIIPTGAVAPLAASQVEELPEGTVRAALDDAAVAAIAAGAKASARAEPDPPPTPRAADKRAQARSLAPPPPETDPGDQLEEVEEMEELEGGASDELDGATIPVFNLADYEKEHRRRHEEALKGRGRAAKIEDPKPPPPAPPPPSAADEFDDAPTRNMDGLSAAARAVPARPPPPAPTRPPPPAARPAAPLPGAQAPRVTGNRLSSVKGPPAALSENSTSEDALLGLRSGTRPPPAPPSPSDDEIALPPRGGTAEEVIPGLSPLRGRPGGEMRSGPAVRPAADPRRPGRADEPPASSTLEDKIPPELSNDGDDDEVVPGLTPRKPSANGSGRQVPAPPAEEPNGGKASRSRPISRPVTPAPEEEPEPEEAPKPPLSKASRVIAMAGGAALVLGIVLIVVLVGPGGGPGGSTPDKPVAAQVTGKIYVKTTPANAEIWMDDKKQDVRSPTILAGIPLDREVTIRAAKDGMEKKAAVTLTKDTLRKDLDLKLEKVK